jgi:hypothetical protein
MPQVHLILSFRAFDLGDVLFCLYILSLFSKKKYDKQDQQGKAAFNERKTLYSWDLKECLHGQSDKTTITYID